MNYETRSIFIRLSLYLHWISIISLSEWRCIFTGITLQLTKNFVILFVELCYRFNGIILYFIFRIITIAYFYRNNVKSCIVSLYLPKVYNIPPPELCYFIKKFVISSYSIHHTSLRIMLYHKQFHYIFQQYIYHYQSYGLSYIISLHFLSTKICYIIYNNFISPYKIPNIPPSKLRYIIISLYPPKHTTNLLNYVIYKFVISPYSIQHTSE